MINERSSIEKINPEIKRQLKALGYKLKRKSYEE
jgi:hypothetical protein